MTQHITTIKKHLPYLSLLSILYILLGIGNASVFNWYDPPFSRFSDLTLHIPRAYQLNDPTLYQRDPVFEATYPRLDAFIFPLYLSKLLPLFGIWWTLIVHAFVLGLIFVIGIYALTYTLFEDYLAALLAAFLASLSYKALGWSQLGFTPDFVVPRTFVVALVPIFILMFLRWRTTGYLWILYAVLGLAANFHALVALHLVLIFTLALIVTSKLSWPLFQQLVIIGGATLIPALPSVVYFIPTFSNVVTVDSGEAAVLLTRYADTLRPRGVDVILFAINFLPLAFFACLGFYQQYQQETKRRNLLNPYLALFIVVLLIPWLGVLLNTFTLSFRQLEMLRITRYYYLWSLPLVGVALSSLLARRPVRILLPLILIIITIFSRQAVGTAIILTSYDWFFEPSPVVERTTEAEVSPELVWDWEAFADMAHWIEANTATDALFITPVTWGQFWVYAQRAVVVNDRGIFGSEWLERINIVQALYEQPNPTAFQDVADWYQADYVIVMVGVEIPQMEVAYANQYYIVYRTR